MGCTDLKIQNPNDEIRDPQAGAPTQIAMVPNKAAADRLLVLVISSLYSLGFVSDFDIRISDFSLVGLVSLGPPYASSQRLALRP
jgi:hypothetical protein